MVPRNYILMAVKDLPSGVGILACIEHCMCCKITTL